MDTDLELKLIDCLSALERGESLEAALARYPADTHRLRPMLEVASALPRLRLEPSQAAKSKSRQAFLAQAATLSEPARPRRRFNLRPFATFASVVLVFILVAGGAAAASASALPGDPLYGVKRLVENVRLSLTPDRPSLAAQFEQERVRETQALLGAGREAEVEFSGAIESIRPLAWVVAGLPVGIDAATRIDGDPQVGLRAQVRGRTANGLLTATSIAVEQGTAPTPPPDAKPSPTPTPPPPPTPTPTPGVTFTRTPSPSPTRTPSPTAGAPTATPQPEEVRFSGVVEQADAQAWTIGGIVVSVNAATDFRGNPAVGHQVEVRAVRYADGQLVATRIERVDAGGNDNGNTNDNSNDNDNGNQNDNDNGNQNDNGNDDNQNDNGGDDHGGNSNDNGNDNGNDDHGGGNDNGNDNGNGNEGD